MPTKLQLTRDCGVSKPWITADDRGQKAAIQKYEKDRNPKQKGSIDP